MNAYLIAPLVLSAFGLVLSAIVLRGHWRKTVHRLIGSYFFILAIYGLIIFAMRASPDTEHAFFWERWFVSPVGVLLAVLFYHFSIRYTGARTGRFVLPGLYLVPFLLASLGATDLLYAGMRIEPFGYAPILGPGMALQVALCYTLTALAAINLIRFYRSSQLPDEKNRALYIIVGLAVSVLGSAFDILPALGLPLYPGLVVGNIVFCLLITVAILRHRLLDIRLVMRKSSAYLMTSVLVLLPFVGIFLILSRVFDLRSIPIWLSIIIMVSLALIVLPLWQVVQRRVDRWFYRNRYDFLEALDTFRMRIQSLTESDKLGKMMVDLLAGALRTRDVYLLRPTPPDDDFHIASSSSLRDISSNVVLKRDSSVTQWLERHGQAITHNDLDLVTEFHGVITGEREMLRDMGGHLIVPLKTPGGKLAGVLILGRKLSEQPYDTEDMQLIFSISSQMAMSLENMRLYEEARQSEGNARRSREQLRSLAKRLQSVREEERRVISCEIHDELGQLLTALKMDLFWLRSRLPGEAQSLTAKIDSMSAITDSSIQTVKRISTELRPAELDDFGLWAAIESHAREFEERSGLRCELESPADEPVLDSGVSVALFRIFQETLTNVARHACATLVRVSLKMEGDSIRLNVTDNGRGITEKEIYAHNSLGLLGMRERTHAYGGNINIAGYPGQGTTVTVAIPVNQKERTNDKNTGS